MAQTDLRSAVKALGAMPEGYCFCSKNRVGDDSKQHEPECADVRAALARQPVQSSAVADAELPLDRWREWARRDDWHNLFVGSDIRQLVGAAERSRELSAAVAGAKVPLLAILEPAPHSPPDAEVSKQLARLALDALTAPAGPGDELTAEVLLARAGVALAAAYDEDGRTEPGDPNPYRTYLAIRSHLRAGRDMTILRALARGEQPERRPAEPDTGSFNPALHVPGMWRCAKCSFVLVQSNLNADDGTVTTRDEAGATCPNDGAPLWRVSWRDHAEEMAQRAEGLVDAIAALEPFSKAVAAIAKHDPGYPENGAALRASFDYWAADGARRCVTLADLRRAAEVHDRFTSGTGQRNEAAQDSCPCEAAQNLLEHCPIHGRGATATAAAEVARWQLQFSNTPPSVTIWAALPGRDPRNTSIAYVEFADDEQKRRCADAFYAIEREHNAAVGAVAGPVMTNALLEVVPMVEVANGDSTIAVPATTLLAGAARRILDADREAPDFGMCDCIDNTGAHYQSADLAAALIDARRALNAIEPGATSVEPAGGVEQ